MNLGMKMSMRMNLHCNLNVAVVCSLATVLLVAGCGRRETDEIVRVSRQSSSGTYEFFREHVLKNKDFKLGSRDMNGSKEVVELVANTPTAIGYSGMGYATPQVKMLKVAEKAGAPAYPPTVENTMNKTYPIARSLHVYTLGEPQGAVKAYIDWIMSDEGQKIVEQTGYVPIPPDKRTRAPKPPELPAGQTVTIQNKGSDTMVNLAQAWAEAYHKIAPNVKIEVSGGGSGVGIAALIKGAVDIANSSRDLKPSEIEQAKKNTGKEPKEFTVGYDALAIYVHKDNPIEEITLEQLAEIFGEGGKITKWSQLGVQLKR
jgi:ABC-type phosphate transport system substrate-binding protein